MVMIVVMLYPKKILFFGIKNGITTKPTMKKLQNFYLIKAGKLLEFGNAS